MNAEQKLSRVLGRDDWERLTPLEVIDRARELEQQAAFAQKLISAMWRKRAPTVGALMNGDAEDRNP